MRSSRRFAEALLRARLAQWFLLPIGIITDGFGDLAGAGGQKVKVSVGL